MYSGAIKFGHAIGAAFLIRHARFNFVAARSRSNHPDLPLHFAWGLGFRV
jgi:hypothetical protein